MKNRYYFLVLSLFLTTYGCGDVQTIDIDVPSDPTSPDFECNDSVCGEHGYCVLKAGTPVCKCEPGYLADNEKMLCIAKEVVENNELCDKYDCSGNGHCVMNGVNTECKCDDGFVANNIKMTCTKEEIKQDPPKEDPENPGQDPEKPTVSCDGVDCGMGSCAVQNDQTVCKCNNGAELDKDKNKCVPASGGCENATCAPGTCKIDADKPVCECPAGFKADNDKLTCVVKKEDNDENRMWDGYQKLVSDYGKECKSDDDCEDFCDSVLNNTCSRRCQSDAECESDDSYDFYCRDDGRCAAKAFVTTWKPIESTTIDGKEYKNVVLFPFGNGECDYKISYSDGTVEEVKSCPEYDKTKGSSLSKRAHIHSFSKIGEDGTVTISVTGKINNWSCGYGTVEPKDLNTVKSNTDIKTLCGNLLTVESFGPVTLPSFAFYKAAALTRISDDDIPNPKGLTNMRYMFESNKAMAYANIAKWDTSNVTNMANTFNTAEKFNAPLGNWNTSKVTDMQGMFNSTSLFNQDISNWDTSNVTNMAYMFANSTFNKPIGNWNVSKVTSMNHTFANAHFNQDISQWDVSNVKDMTSMFNGDSSFSKDISGWNTASLENISYAFRWTSSLNRDLSKWNVSNVKNCDHVFQKSGIKDDTLKNMCAVPAWKTLFAKSSCADIVDGRSINCDALLK